jgi:hypothetical protein
MLVLQEKRMNMKVPIAAPLVWIVMPTRRQRTQVHHFAPLAKPVNIPLRAALNVHLVLLAKQEREKMGRVWIVKLTLNQRARVRQVVTHVKLAIVPMRAAPNVRHVLLVNQEQEKMGFVKIVRMVNSEAAA